MKTQVEEYICKAYEVLEKEIAEMKKKGKTAFPKEFKGYIAGFGPSIRMSGLLSTLAFYSAKGSAKEDRSKILEWLCEIINHSGGDRKILFKYVIDNQADSFKMQHLENQLCHAVTALKLVFRTYPVEGDKSDSETQMSNNP